MFSKLERRGVAGFANGRSRAIGRATWLRNLHALVGIIASLNLLVLVATGLLLQHATTFHLDDCSLSRRFLPSSYRPQDVGEAVRADIVIADLHSGRIFGTAGRLFLDMVTVAWLVLLLTGVFMYSARFNNHRRE